MRSGAVGAVVLALILVIGLGIFIGCRVEIPAGYVGIVYDIRGGVSENVLTQGWKWVSPTKRVTTYTVGLEQSGLTSGNTKDSKGDESFNVPTSDGKTVKVSVEFSYRFNEDRITDTFTMFKGASGDEIKKDFIKPKIMAWSQEVSAHHPVVDIFGDKRTVINNELDKHLKEKFMPYGIIMDTINLTQVVVDPETEAAIQKKVNAQQEQELAMIESETAKVQAEKDRQVAVIAAEKDKEVATINAEKQIIAATAEADSLIIRAEAEAEANKKIAASITDELLEKIKYETWDGVLPKVSGGNSTNLINVDGI